jgi:hypothetical protein
VRRAAVAAAVVAGSLAVPATANAHLRTGRVAVDYEATVTPLRPSVARALAVRVYRADLALGLRVLDGHRVVVLGYTGEPFLRLDAGGAYASRSSLTAAGLGLVGRHSGTGWQLVSRSPRLIWHDARVRGLPAGVEHGRWAVPVLVDGTRTELTGALTRAPRPPAWPWLALGAAFAAGTALVLALRRPMLLRPAATLLGWICAVATILLASGFALATTASEGTWVEAVNEIVFALVGLAFLVRGSRDTRAIAGGALGLFALAVGLKGVPVLLHGVVLSALPAGVARAAVALAVSAGAAATVVGLVVFFDVLEHYEEPALLDRHH